MSEFRAALQALVDLNAEHYSFQCKATCTCAFCNAAALLARPEPRITEAHECGTSYESVPGIAYPRKKPRTVQPVDDEPDPRITREEAIALLDQYYEVRRSGLHARVASIWREEMTKAREACLAAMLRSEPPTIARPLSEWNESHGFVTWWKFPIEEPSWIGSPTDSDWPGYHTHWTPHPELPCAPAGCDGEQS